MFTPAGLFRNIACPERENCRAVNCIFSHEAIPLPKRDDLKSNGHVEQRRDTSAGHETKRRRIDTGQANGSMSRTLPAGTARADTIKEQLKQARTTTHAADLYDTAPKSLRKAITPPVIVGNRASGSTTRKQTTVPVAEALNPRLLPAPPAGHEKRSVYLKHIHEQMSRLNGLLSSSSDDDGKAKFTLGHQEVIKTSLDEEEQLAKDNPIVYANIVKQRIGFFKKLDLHGWLSYLESKRPKPEAARPKAATERKQITTGLTADEETILLDAKMLCNEETLRKLGFVLEPPADDAVKDAELMVAQAANWEVCDRCKTRFQVFPERRVEDGVLTTNGPCLYHWGKLRRPKREKTDAQTGTKESVYLCCGELMNSTGCVTAESHVYKVNEPTRLASVLQFVDTHTILSSTRSPGTPPYGAITFDCEMAYTVHGMEIVRLTAISWPANDRLVDVLVQPKGTVLDFNSRFSGVTADMFKAARAYTRTDSTPSMMADTSVEGAAKSLPMIASPEAARELLCSYMSADTILIGHALENDLNVLRLCHSKIADTVALYPHPAGLPIRHGLKHLSLVHLDRDIQTGGAAGHDSLEDAVATGDLVRVKVGKVWNDLQAKGWRFNGQEMVRP